ncbi:hypothetical protein E2C01_000395 [Portunus trituberculatus]|uniref:Uncharacterized protein n=1 Tax=Portunus trituberculatus TaxID=210409 RepID=A0A5B7CF09_PORTR|nr:hypothetical protein [Portunus trituberculatus]
MRECKLRLMFITVNIGVKMSGITRVEEVMECEWRSSLGVFCRALSSLGPWVVGSSPTKFDYCQILPRMAG